MAAALLLAAAPVTAQGAKTSMPVETADSALKPGEWIWSGDLAPEGPLLILVDLSAQLAHVYRNGVRIGVTTVSTGKKGHRTPTGVFTILQKNKDHKSNLYNNAPMPYMQRLTWDGIAIHAGNLPGYPASHGCVRMPIAFTEKLWTATKLGMTVIVADDATTVVNFERTSLFLPTSPSGKTVGAAEPQLDTDESYRWKPEKAPEGPLTVLISRADERMIVLRNGEEIGRARVRVPEDVRAGRAVTLRAVVDGVQQWQFIELPGSADTANTSFDPTQFGRLAMPRAFREQVRAAVTVGTTVFLTDQPLTGASTGRELTVIAADDPGS